MKRVITRKPLVFAVMGVMLGLVWLASRAFTDANTRGSNLGLFPIETGANGRQATTDAGFDVDHDVGIDDSLISKEHIQRVDEFSKGDTRPSVIYIDRVEHRIEWEGLVRRVYRLDGTLQSEGTVIDGKFDGEMRSWHDNGTLHAVVTWVGGLREGREATYFSRTGILISVGDWKQGFKFGLWEDFYPESGVRQNHGEYSLGGDRTGTWDEWHPNGNPSSHGSFIDDKKSGFWKYWRENGEFWKSGSYLEGKKQGAWYEVYFGDLVNEDDSGFYDHGKKVK